MLIVPFPQSALNEEAGKLFMESYDDYYQKAKILTQIYAVERKKENINAEDRENSMKMKARKKSESSLKLDRQRSRDKRKDRRKGVLKSVRNQQNGARSGSFRKISAKIRDKKWFRRI